ncbi:MAG: diguanylate cyclase [Rhodoferax sp.]|nr:MAG: diguanylate cyclase [Rhodoferax sp.]
MHRVLVLLLLLASGVTQAMESVTLQLKWRHQFQFAGYYAALEQGYYRDAGLDVKLVEAMPATNVVDEVVSGRAHYGVGTSELLLARRQSPVVALAVIFQHSPLILLAREDKIGNLHQLAGQEVMLESHSEELLAYMRKENLRPESLHIRHHSQNFGDLIDGKVAAMSAYSTTEPYLLRRAGLSTIEFSPRAVGIDFYGDNLFTSQDELRMHPERVRAFRAASLRGWEYAMKHPEEVITLILNRYDTQGLNRDMLAFEADRTAQLMQNQLVEIGYMNPGRWQHIADIYAELEMQPKGQLPDDFLYSTNPQRLPSWLTPTAAIAVMTILVLAALVQRNIRLSRQLRREIAAQSLVHEQLEKSEEHSRFMLEHSADTFWELDSQFRFTFVSEADHRMRGFEASEVLGQSLFQMLTPSSLLAVQQGIAARQQAEKLGEATGPMRFEFEMYCKDGSTVWAESNSMPLRDDQGNIVGFHGVTRDISEQKRHRTELQQANGQLSRQLEEIQELQSRLQEQAIRDALTGLYNRRYLDETLPRELSRAKRDGYPLALIMVDIDHFKQVNDTYGHSAGDEVIRSLGAILREGAREADIACRYGGEEFVIALPRMNLSAALERAERWRAQVQAIEVQHGDFKIHFSISAGVAGYPDHASDHESLVQDADLALYKSKNEGRNRVTCFDPSRR